MSVHRMDGSKRVNCILLCRESSTYGIGFFLRIVTSQLEELKILERACAWIRGAHLTIILVLCYEEQPF